MALLKVHIHTCRNKEALLTLDKRLGAVVSAFIAMVNHGSIPKQLSLRSEAPVNNQSGYEPK